LIALFQPRFYDLMIFLDIWKPYEHACHHVIRLRLLTISPQPASLPPRHRPLNLTSFLPRREREAVRRALPAWKDGSAFRATRTILEVQQFGSTFLYSNSYKRQTKRPLLLRRALDGESASKSQVCQQCDGVSSQSTLSHHTANPASTTENPAAPAKTTE
jgi:hypothetical protein